MFWLGPQRDYSIHRGLDPVLAPLQEADYIVKPFNAATLKTKIEAVFPDMASA